MRVASPQPVDDKGNYAIMVQNELQLSTLHRVMPALYESIRNRLSNDSITFTVSVNTDIDNPVAWNDREVLTKMMENHPEFKNMVKRFNLTIT